MTLRVLLAKFFVAHATEKFDLSAIAIWRRLEGRLLSATRLQILIVVDYFNQKSFVLLELISIKFSYISESFL